MRLTNTIPKIGPIPELYVFICVDCGEVSTVEAPDPTVKELP
jgi:hypothetical protein